MFDDVCFVCGKDTSGSLYCSAECQILDSSPSISSSSSSRTSPRFDGFDTGDDSRPPSPTTPPLLLDDPAFADENAVLGLFSELSVKGNSDAWRHPLPPSPAHFLHSVPKRHSGLTYARTPGQTNMGSSAAPHLHRRTSSTSSAAGRSPFTSPSPSPALRPVDSNSPRAYPMPVQTPKQKKNRASLPAYFSSLKTTPIVSPTPYTVLAARSSPPTPKNSATSIVLPDQVRGLDMTPRGRRGRPADLDRERDRSSSRERQKESERGRATRRHSSPMQKTLRSDREPVVEQERGRSRVTARNGAVSPVGR